MNRCFTKSKKMSRFLLPTVFMENKAIYPYLACCLALGLVVSYRLEKYSYHYLFVQIFTNSLLWVLLSRDDGDKHIMVRGDGKHREGEELDNSWGALCR